MVRGEDDVATAVCMVDDGLGLFMLASSGDMRRANTAIVPKILLSIR